MRRHDVIKTGASATIKADNYTGDTNKLAFSLKGKHLWASIPNRKYLQHQGK